MAPLRGSVVAALAALVIFPAFLASATEFIVGDDSGWRIGVDYEAWAKGKKFFVGDTLVFKYKEGYHSVVKVNGTGFAECTVSPNNGTLTSGSDRINLATPGNKWYICGVSDHCSYYSQKLKITVLPRALEYNYYDAPAPAPSPAATEVSPAAAPWSGPADNGWAPAPAPMESGTTPRKWGPPSPAPAAWSSAPVENKPKNEGDYYYSPPSPAPADPWAPVPGPWAVPSLPPADGSEYNAPAPAPAWWPSTPEASPVEPPY